MLEEMTMYTGPGTDAKMSRSIALEASWGRASLVVKLEVDQL